MSVSILSVYFNVSVEVVLLSSSSCCHSSYFRIDKTE